jgi:Right handed beta helix region/Protein of unknown function (DUF1565)
LLSRKWVITAALAGLAVLTAGVVGVRWAARDDASTDTATGCTHYVSTTGSDSAQGSSAEPWRTVHAAISKLAAGDTLCVRRGTYDEEVGGPLPKGNAASRITLLGLSQDGERPMIRGGFALIDPDYWTISGLHFTNPSPANDDNRLVSILGGTDWVFQNNEVADGPYAGLLVGASETGGPPRDYTIRGNVVHDTGATNLYLNPSRFSTGGLVERNIFFASGTENVKLGWGGNGGCHGRKFNEFGIGGVTFRNNTLHDAKRGALIIAEPGGLHDVDVYGNLFTDEPEYLVRYDSVEGCLGDRVKVHDNAGGLAHKFGEDFGDSPANVSSEHGNVFPIDPDYGSTGPDGFLPQNPGAQPFGRYGYG